MAANNASGAPDPFNRGGSSNVQTEEMILDERQAAGLKVYVKLDMEGISGVVSPEQISPGGQGYEYAQTMLMHDLQAVLEGAFAAGCDEALIYDAHGDGRNVDLRAVDRRAAVIVGRPDPTNDFVYGLDDSFAALFLIGYHARAGAAGALFPHTYDQDVASIRVNGTVVGEIGLEAALAGEFGLPLAFVSSDAGGVREARELLGDDLEVVEVKRAITPITGICLPAAATATLLRQGAALAIQRAADMPLVVFPSPTTLDVEFRKPDTAAALEKMAAMERLEETVIRSEGPDILTAYRQFIDAWRGRSATRTALRPYTSRQAPPGNVGNPRA